MDSTATDEIITDEDVQNSELEKGAEVDMKKMDKQFKKVGKMMKKEWKILSLNSNTLLLKN